MDKQVSKIDFRKAWPLFQTGAIALNISFAGRQSSEKNNINMISNKITRVVSIFVLTCALLAGFFIGTNVLAQTETDNYGLDKTAGMVTAYKSQVGVGGNNFLATKVGSLIGLVLSFIGVLFLLLMIFAGLSWMTAQGNSEKVTKAKDLMINAIIGLIIVLAAYAITAFVGDNLI